MYAVIVLSLSAAVPQTEPLSIEQEDSGRRIQVTLRLSAEQYALLSSEQPLTFQRGQRHLQLALLEPNGTPGPPIFARYALHPRTLVLRPRYALRGGGEYLATATLPDGRQLVKRYRVPLNDRSGDLPRVTAVYPSGDRLPANCLKFYLHFSQPMREGREIFEQITIEDETGHPLPDPWRRTELWTADARRLTLWIHPGRIKRGVNLRQELGPVLVPDREYRLVISTAVRAAAGRQLAEPFIKPFRTRSEDRSRPLPKTWQIQAPRRSTRDPLRVAFGEPLDRALLTRFLHIAGPSGTLPGRIEIGAGERTWSFYPAHSWGDEPLRLQVDGNLEDLAGNTPWRLFDTDLASQPFESPELEVAVTLEDAPSSGPFTPADRRYWAFQRVRRPSLPVVKQQGWSRNPIDLFVLQQLESANLVPSPDAERATWIRRLTFDLIGLPPTPAEVRAFIDDRSPDAWDRVIDRLLHSPHHGERWARHWLDLARYAESDGFETDLSRAHAWRYRDYVVRAFNGDKPYDRFVREQIAGDELWPRDLQARIATGFNRHYPEEGNNKDLLLARQEILHDVTDTVGATFLGLTFNCARCHDHKFDPILQRDYYRLQAFFANMSHDDRLPLAEPQQVREYEQQLAVWQDRTRRLWGEMDALLATVRKYSPAQLLARYPDYVIAAVQLPAAERTPIQAQIVYLLTTKDCNTCPLKPPPFLDPNFKRDAGKLTGEEQQRFKEIEAELKQLDALRPVDLPRGSGIFDISRRAPATHVLGVGQHTSPGERVEPGFLSILDARAAWVEAPPDLSSTGRRTALANWLVDPANPLTARVMCEPQVLSAQSF